MFLLPNLSPAFQSFDNCHRGESDVRHYSRFRRYGGLEIFRHENLATDILFYVNSGTVLRRDVILYPFKPSRDQCKKRTLHGAETNRTITAWYGKYNALIIHGTYRSMVAAVFTAALPTKQTATTRPSKKKWENNRQ